MTQNTIKFNELLENKLHNRETEAQGRADVQTRRASLAENIRSNKAKEAINWFEQGWRAPVEREKAAAATSQSLASQDQARAASYNALVASRRQKAEAAQKQNELAEVQRHNQVSETQQAVKVGLDVAGFFNPFE